MKIELWHPFLHMFRPLFIKEIRSSGETLNWWWELTYILLFVFLPKGNNSSGDRAIHHSGSLCGIDSLPPPQPVPQEHLPVCHGQASDGWGVKPESIAPSFIYTSRPDTVIGPMKSIISKIIPEILMAALTFLSI